MHSPISNHLNIYNQVGIISIVFLGITGQPVVDPSTPIDNNVYYDDLDSNTTSLIKQVNGIKSVAIENDDYDIAKQ